MFFVLKLKKLKTEVLSFIQDKKMVGVVELESTTFTMST